MDHLKIDTPRRMAARWLAAVALTLLGGGVSMGAAWAVPLLVADARLGPGFDGEASWYGPGFQGRPTASGERFNSKALTAAHRSLPFGTRVRVENLRTGRSVDVRINDRGPYAHRRRIIDLSEAAGRVLGLGRGGAGVAQVRITILPKPRR